MPPPADKALQYILRKGIRIDMMMISTLLHLNTRFSLGFRLEKLRDRLLKNPPPKREPLLRFVDRSLIASELEVRVMKGIDRITACALYCDRYPLPWDFYSELEKMLETGGYHATHALMAVAVLREQKCPVDETRLRVLTSKLQDAMINIITEPGRFTDLRIEAVLMLYLSGAPDRVRREWLLEMAREQQPDGSFFASDHSTVLAAWVFLEHAAARRNRRPQTP